MVEIKRSSSRRNLSLSSLSTSQRQIGLLILGILAIFGLVWVKNATSSDTTIATGGIITMNKKMSKIGTIIHNGKMIQREIMITSNRKQKIQLTMHLNLGDDDSTSTGNTDDAAVQTNAINAVSVTIHDNNSKNNNDDNSSCSPQFTLRLVGDAIVYIHLENYDDNNNDDAAGDWSGSFTIPMDGDYTVDMRWYDCSSNNNNNADGGGYQSLLQDDPIHIEAKSSGGTSSITTLEETDSLNSNNKNDEWSPSSKLFAKGLWIENNNNNNDKKNKKKNENQFPSSTDNDMNNILLEQQYIYMDPNVHLQDTVYISAMNSIVTSQGNIDSSSSSTTDDNSNGYYEFGVLSNYELVCFMGSQSADYIRQSFLNLRITLFNGQRPFKFHYYPINNFKHPSKSYYGIQNGNWTTSKMLAFRKCKHIIVSIDELYKDNTKNNDNDNSISQKEYIHDVKTFISHMLSIFNDDTFPAIIWMLTTNFSPSSYDSSSSSSLTRLCHSPIVVIPKTTDHPCNDALRELFKTENFPSRVRLLDNTDITLPLLLSPNNNHNIMPLKQEVVVDNNDENIVIVTEPSKLAWDIYSVIAHRIFIIIGKQVQIWRNKKQIGSKDGLHVNDTIIPNFVQVPYDGWD